MFPWYIEDIADPKERNLARATMLLGCRKELLAWRRAKRFHHSLKVGANEDHHPRDEAEHCRQWTPNRSWHRPILEAAFAALKRAWEADGRNIGTELEK